MGNLVHDAGDVMAASNPGLVVCFMLEMFLSLIRGSTYGSGYTWLGDTWWRFLTNNEIVLVIFSCLCVCSRRNIFLLAGLRIVFVGGRQAGI